MNPFLETPLAVHQPGARWRRTQRRARAAAAGQPAVAPGVAGAGPSLASGDSAEGPSCRRGRQRAAARAASFWPLRRAAGILRAVMLAGALAVPGAAFAAVDLNVATPEQLQEVKGIGPKMARVIIEERDRGGRYASIDDLAERVKGIGPKKAAALQASGLVAGDAESKAAEGRGTAAQAPRRGR